MMTDTQNRRGTEPAAVLRMIPPGEGVLCFSFFDAYTIIGAKIGHNRLFNRGTADRRGK